ncbi:hypothetical protein [Pseudooctadecabacter sp.]|uniref:hypothetical protein n=1 Tax=Pseudooctadecabacter sp. TaxID=1966338 RepID=UPI0035C81102
MADALEHKQVLKGDLVKINCFQYVGGDFIVSSWETIFLIVHELTLIAPEYHRDDRGN